MKLKSKKEEKSESINTSCIFMYVKLNKILFIV